MLGGASHHSSRVSYREYYHPEAAVLRIKARIFGGGQNSTQPPASFLAVESFRPFGEFSHRLFLLLLCFGLGFFAPRFRSSDELWFFVFWQVFPPPASFLATWRVTACWRVSADLLVGEFRRVG